MSDSPIASRSIDTTDLARVATVSAVIAVLGLPGGVSVFGSVPITAQTLGVMLAGALLGPWLGALSLTVLLALVAAGLPLLAGGRGGLGVFVGPSVGYLLGWIAGAAVVGLIVHTGRRKPVLWRTFTGIVTGGILVIYAFGIPIQSLITRLPLGETALMSLAFLPGDLIKAVLATAIVMTLVRAYPRAFRRTWAAKAAPPPTYDTAPAA